MTRHRQREKDLARHEAEEDDDDEMVDGDELLISASQSVRKPSAKDRMKGNVKGKGRLEEIEDEE